MVAGPYHGEQMRLINGEFTNFGSYKHLEMDIKDQGLSLIYGKTGAGKSTILDAICWTLFGVTSKDGKSSDVISWTADEDTMGRLVVTTHNDVISIERTRSKRSSSNDLKFTQIHGDVIRGKDITETQKLLNERLGVDIDTFVAGSYFHEFSPTGTFFTAKAKDRRDLFEKLTNLDLPNKLALKCTEAKKTTKATLDTERKNHAKLQGRIDQLDKDLKSMEGSAVAWDDIKVKTIAAIEAKLNNYEKDQEAKKQHLKFLADKFSTNNQSIIRAAQNTLEGLRHDLEYEQANESKPCITCGYKPEGDMNIYYLTQNIKRAEEGLDALRKQANPHLLTLSSLKNAPNPYYEALVAEKERINPWVKESKRLTFDLIASRGDSMDSVLSINALEDDLSNFSTLYDLSADLRGHLLKSAIGSVETDTNNYLEKYFDAEIRVAFVADGDDNLDVTIYKSGHECSYKQLSKGQRGLLKLCFSVSVQQAISAACGTHFDSLFFDESLDGYDDNLKIRAFNLFQSLVVNHSTIMVIDHAESLQNLFHKKYHVTLEGDESRMDEES